MNLKNLALYSAAIAATLAGVGTANAAFGVNLATTTSDAASTQATRLYNNAGFTLASQANATDPNLADPLWLVFDVDGDGIFNSGALTGAIFDGTQTGLRNSLIDADDYVIMDWVHGPIAGRNNAAFTGLPTELQTGGVGANDAGGIVKPTYALLFDDVNIADGGTFGVNGALTAGGAIPDTGNVQLRIGENTAADTYAFTPIPEPSAAAFVGLGLAGLALLRRRVNRA